MIKQTAYTGKTNIRKGDTVVIISGKNKGKSGTVVSIFPKKQKALVEGDAAIFFIKHVKANPQAGEEGGRVEKLRPIHTSNLALLDPTTGKPCRVRREKDGKNVIRVSKSSGHKFD